jgi:hypothetical protein
MSQGTQGYRFKKKTEDQKSRETVPLSNDTQRQSLVKWGHQLTFRWE